MCHSGGGRAQVPQVAGARAASTRRVSVRTRSSLERIRRVVK